MESEYRIRVDRGPLPPLSALEEIYSKGGVSDLFDEQFEWKKHSSREGANDVTANEVVMVMKCFTGEEIAQIGGLHSENIIAWGLKNGLVPADKKETHAFGINAETRHFQNEFSLVGLGSFAIFGGFRFVARLYSDSGKRCLDFSWFDSEWHSSHRFLFVRKPLNHAVHGRS